MLGLAFPVEGSWQTAGVRVRQGVAGVALGEAAGTAGGGMVAGVVTGEIVSQAEPGLVAEIGAQVERILSLDVDGSGFSRGGRARPGGR
jgi:hypothetical protein